MAERINIGRLEPEAYKILAEMENYLAKTNLDAKLSELIKIRVSQINGCAYCLDMHTKDARTAGETEQRIYALSGWKESPLFSAEERAALQLAEEITKIYRKGVSDEVYAELKNHFDDHQIAQMILVISQINFWNRYAISTKMVHV